jgi:lipopolysaccharide assembly protein A
MRSKVQLVIAAVLATMAVIILFQNVEPVPVKLLFVTVTMPRAALLAVTLLAGFTLGVLFSLRGRK